ncbi:hypothetical protein TRVL_02670 [Trypanosoma vivax]|nr:hypothetical protein TRVL_02670 [Trypanosoma vivax]
MTRLTTRCTPRRRLCSDSEQGGLTAVEDRRLFARCVEQVQQQLKVSVNSVNALGTLASYYTRVEPIIDGRPFCVSLSYATFLFHIQMARVSEYDVQLYVQLLTVVLSQIPDDAKLRHPFVRHVLHDCIFGLPSAQSDCPSHCVVLVPPLNYRAFAVLATSLVERDVVPVDVVFQWQDRLKSLCRASSPLVANRASSLLVRTASNIHMDEMVKILLSVLKTKPLKLNVDFLLACYERLKRAVPCVLNGPTYGRALSVHCSELFLRFRSPIRREYAERFLYPSLGSADMKPFTDIPETRKHLCKELLRMCTPGMSNSNPYYMCICAILQWSFEDVVAGAMEVVTLVNCLMPHAAYFMATLAVDTRMSATMLAKIVIVLVRGAGLAMTGRHVDDDVADALKDRPSVYNVLFLLREVVRSCSTTVSRRGADMLKTLQVAVPSKTVEALGKLAQEAFSDCFGSDGDRVGVADSCAVVHPQLLCAELSMVLHQVHISEAMDAVVMHLRDASSVCIFCGKGRGTTVLCEINRTVHLTGQAAVGRVLRTLAECAGMPSVGDKLIRLLRDPVTQMDSAVHFLLFNVLVHAGQHRSALFAAVEPYVRSTLTALVSADDMSSSRPVSSVQKANVLMLHVKLVILLASIVEPSYVESILRTFYELRLRSNHDALALWYMANLLLRQSKGNVELLPTDPAENSYCVSHPNCAPACNKSADNAQLILKIIDRSHGHSDKMRKLVGCCVCKLIQDFNMQMPNIIGALLSPLGFVPVCLKSLIDYALPVGSNSAFWTFVLHQLKTSVPARTAFMTALARSIAQRFRIAAPAAAVPRSGTEITAHPFSVMTYEAMKRNAPLARAILHIMSQWVTQSHPPGRFACLLYINVQLITVVARRGQGPDAAEVEVETPQDVHQFEDATVKAARVVRTQLQRLSKLGTAVRRENKEFYQLIKHLYIQGKRAVEEVSGEQCEGCFNDFESGGDDDDGGGQRPDDAVASQPGHVCETVQDADLYSLESIHQSLADNTFEQVVDSGNAVLPVFRDAEERDGVLSVQSAPRGVLETAEDKHTRVVSSVSSKRNQSTMTSPTGSLSSSRYKRTREVSFVLDVDNGSTNATVSENVVEPQQPSASVMCKAYTADGEEIVLEGKHVADTCSTLRAEKGGTLKFPPPSPTEVSFEQGTKHDMSALDGIAPSRRMSEILAAAAAVGGNGDSGVWNEPNMDSVPGDEEPIDRTSLPKLQGAHAVGDGVAVPSGLVLQYLSAHQEVGSILDELQQSGGNIYPEHQRRNAPPALSSFGKVSVAAGEGRLRIACGVNEYHRPHCNPHPPLVPPRTAILPVTVERKVNNYSMPHSGQGQAPTKVVMVRVKMLETVERQKGLRAVEALGKDAQCQSRQQGHVEREDVDEQCDGEWGAVQAGHHERPPQLQGHQSAEQSQCMPQRCDISQGITTRLVRQSAVGVIQELGAMRGQAESMASMTPEGRKAVDSLDHETPYGQMILPRCFVEQKNETAVREVRQVMGFRDPNDGRLSSGAGRKGLAGGDGSGAENSSAWWAETSSVPMPQYAENPQFSMELF